MTTFFTAPSATHPALARLRHAGFDSRRIEQVLALYDEPHRHYHDREHIGEMLDAALALELQLAPEQALALLFHDAVYVPGAPHGCNEQMSAQLLRVYGYGVSVAQIDKACAIVLDTAEHVARSTESQIVLDLDLMRLAAPWPGFEVFSHAILAEQRALFPPDDDEAWRRFNQRRVPFFEQLLARAAIYENPVCWKQWENVARENLRTALAQWGGEASDAATVSDSRETV